MDIGSGSAYPSEFCGRLMKLRMGKKLEEDYKDLEKTLDKVKEAIWF